MRAQNRAMTTTAHERDLVVARLTGRRVQSLLFSMDVKKYAAAEAIGVGASTFSQKLRGNVPITVDELVGLARLLEVDVVDLLPSLDEVEESKKAVTAGGGHGLRTLLPRLDSNQQPCDYRSRLVRGSSQSVRRRLTGHRRTATLRCPRAVAA